MWGQYNPKKICATKPTGGEVHDSKVADKLIKKIRTAEYLIADKGYDSEAIRQQATEAGMEPIIPRKINSKKPNPTFDKHLYKQRHLVENRLCCTKVIFGTLAAKIFAG